jgi:[ribosomal protein S18]-alanine N-acetyltransferase
VQVDLRDFRRDDFEALWTIDQQCFPPGISYSRLELAAYITRRGSLTLIAEGLQVELTGRPCNGAKSPSTTLGFVVAELRRNVGHIITIDVLPQWRRQGIGSTLLDACEARLEAQHCRSVVLETAVDNTAALSFYKRHQYHVVKTIPHYYRMGVDAFVLSKPLSGS